VVVIPAFHSEFKTEWVEFRTDTALRSQKVSERFSKIVGGLLLHRYVNTVVGLG
jgi:hypothetical protein